MCPLAFAEAQPRQDRKSNIPLFQSHQPLEMMIQGDFPEVNKSNAPQENPSPGRLTYFVEGKATTLDVQLEARGGGRSSWCQFGPLKLKLGAANQTKAEINETLKPTIFNKSRTSLRLVTHCNSAVFPVKTSWDNIVLTEYALYKILENSGLPALKTRLAQARYKDRRGKDFQKGYLLILENAGDLAQRYGLEEFDRMRTPLEFPQSRVTFDIGLQLIASARDHFYGQPGNSFFIGKNNPYQLIQVPFDFVYHPEGFPYHPTTTEKYPSNWLKEYAQQFPHFNEEIKHWVQVIVSNKQNIRKGIEEVPYLADAPQKQHLINWTNEFFTDAEKFLLIK